MSLLGSFEASQQGQEQRAFDDNNSVASDTDSLRDAAPVLVHHEEPGQATTRADESRCVSQDIYEDSGNKKKVLYLLCIGLNHNELPLFSFDDEPWSLLPKTSIVCPQNSHLVKEASRRAELYNITPVPRPQS
jgi:hypothetical protein